jgi:hypothetical protein
MRHGNFDLTPESPELARSWWWGARLGLLMLVVGGGVLALALALGAADPPRAGALWARYDLLDAPPDSEIVVPPAPYTLEVSGRCREGAAAEATWGVALHALTDADPSARATVQLHLDSVGFYAMPPLVNDTTYFIHLRHGGQPNTLTLHLEADDHATLHLNHEIAWQGAMPGLRNGTRLRWVNSPLDAPCRPESLAIYAP